MMTSLLPVSSPSIPSPPDVPEVTLTELPVVAGKLVARVRERGFAPDVIVYVERGARLLAWELCREFQCAAIAVTVQRKGGSLKRALSRLVRVLPRALRDVLRRWDERWLWSRAGGAPRAVGSTFAGSLAGRRVLLVDDACDSGRTIAGCLAWLSARGVERNAVTIAVLAATTPAGRAAVDCWVLERNSRLPWSSDSPDKAAADMAWTRCQPPAYS